MDWSKLTDIYEKIVTKVEELVTKIEKTLDDMDWSKLTDIYEKIVTKVEDLVTKNEKRLDDMDWSKLTDIRYKKIVTKVEELVTKVKALWKRCPLSNLKDLEASWNECPLSSFAKSLRDEWMNSKLRRIPSMSVKESIVALKEMYSDAGVRVQEMMKMVKEQVEKTQKAFDEVRTDAMELYSSIEKIDKDTVQQYVDELIMTIKNSGLYMDAELKIKEVIAKIRALVKEYDTMMRESAPRMMERAKELMEEMIGVLKNMMTDMKERFPYARTTLEYIDNSMGLREGTGPIKITRRLEDYFIDMKKRVQVRTGQYMKSMRAMSKKGLVEARKMTVCLQDGWDVTMEAEEYILSIYQETCPYVAKDVRIPVMQIPGAVLDTSMGWMRQRNCSASRMVLRVIRVTRVAVNTTRDIIASEDFPEAMDKTRQVMLKGYKELLTKYDEMLRKAQAMYKKLSQFNVTAEYMKARNNYWLEAQRMYARKVVQLERLIESMDWNQWPLRKIQWSPPFNSTAMIFGRPHVLTFDGKYFEFPGYRRPECTYVLARDSHDGHIKIGHDGAVETVVKILPDGKVVTDGHFKELPVEMANTTVSRQGSVIKVVNTKGLEVVCDLEHFLCTINVAGWYHNKLAGLLGTHNNEQYDEFTLPTGELTSNIAAFANAWEITKAPACRIREDANLVPLCSKKASPRCEELLNSNTSTP